MVKTTEIATVGAGRPKKGSQRQIDNAEFKRLKIIRDEKELETIFIFNTFHIRLCRLEHYTT
jgi:hypothetical protein